MYRFVLLLTLLPLANYSAGEAPAPADPEKALRAALERKISFEFAETPIAEALMFFTSLSKLNIIFDPDAFKDAKPISLKVENVVMFDAFKQLLDKAGLELQCTSDSIRIVKKGPPPREELKPLSPVTEWEKKFCEKLQKKASFEFVDTPLDEAVAFFAGITRLNFMIDPKLVQTNPPTLNLNVKDETLESALMKILRLSGANYEFFNEGFLIRQNGTPRGKELKPFTPVSDTEKGIKKKLQRKVSFEFVDTPLPEAINFLTSLTKTTIILDSAIDGNTPVTLRVQDMEMENALLWIMLLTETRYAMRDDALFIAARETLAANVLAPLTAEQTAAFKNAVGGLGSEDFDARDKATKTIEALGPAALLLLEAEQKSAKDPESAARIAALIASIPYKMKFDEPADVTKLLGDEKFSRKVTVDFVETPLAECVRFLNVSENLGLAWDRAAEQTINLRVVDMETRNALRWIARLGGARFTVVDSALKIVKTGQGPKSEPQR